MFDLSPSKAAWKIYCGSLLLYIDVIESDEIYNRCGSIGIAPDIVAGMWVQTIWAISLRVQTTHATNLVTQAAKPTTWFHSNPLIICTLYSDISSTEIGAYLFKFGAIQNCHWLDVATIKRVFGLRASTFGYWKFSNVSANIAAAILRVSMYWLILVVFCVAGSGRQLPILRHMTKT
jgi:hypothetical protein